MIYQDDPLQHVCRAILPFWCAFLIHENFTKTNSYRSKCVRHFSNVVGDSLFVGVIIPLVEQMSVTISVRGVSVTQALDFCVVFWWTLFQFLVFVLTIVLSVLPRLWPLIATLICSNFAKTLNWEVFFFFIQLVQLFMIKVLRYCLVADFLYIYSIFLKTSIFLFKFYFIILCASCTLQHFFFKIKLTRLHAY